MMKLRADSADESFEPTTTIALLRPSAPAVRQLATRGAAPMPAGTILVVDDEPDVRSAMCRMLGSCYPRVRLREAGDGDEALATLDDDVVCIISDVVMPRLDGYHLCWTIRHAAPCCPWREVPVILVSARRRTGEAVRRAWDAGTALLLSKPFSLRDLAEAILRATGIAPEPAPHFDSWGARGEG